LAGRKSKRGPSSRQALNLDDDQRRVGDAAAVEAEPDAFVMRDGQMRAWAAERSAAERDAFAWA
jgi:hypothetical protein